MPRPEGYETPRTPPSTPPVIDPDVEPKSANEMKADDESEGEIHGHRSDPDQIDTELSETLKERQARDGAGEEELDAMRPETLLPPD